MKEKMVKVKLPLSRSDSEGVFVGVNGQSWLIDRGKEVEIPWNVAKVLERQEKMLAKAIEFEKEAAEPLNKMKEMG